MYMCNETTKDTKHMYMYVVKIINVYTCAGQAPGAFQVVGSKSSNSTTSSPTPSNTSSDSGIAGEGVCVWGGVCEGVSVRV